jgi:fatty-acyl-CoA synthase
MKTAFSTLGCPDWSWDEIVTMAKDLAFDGIEIRGVGQELIASRTAPFRPTEKQATLHRLSSLGIGISCISSSCCLTEATTSPACLEEGFDSIDLAASIGCRFVRILADRNPHPTTAVDDIAITTPMVSLAAHALLKGVVLLVETNGAFGDSMRLRRLIDRVASPAVAVLWDIHHTFRFFGESPEMTLHNLGDLVRYVHVKDSVLENGRIRYRMTGYGDVPIADALSRLIVRGFEGTVSFEWVKRWSRDLEDAAVVFPHFAEYMRRTLAGTTPAPSLANGPGDIALGQESTRFLDLTVGGLLEDIATRFPDQPAVVYTDRPYRRSYSEFLEEVDATARGLLSIGIRTGDHVAIWATNRPEWLLVLFATARIGAILVTVNTSYKVFELEYLLRQSDSSTLILMEGFKGTNYLGTLAEICPELQHSTPGRLESSRLPLLRRVVCIDPVPYAGSYSWQEVLSLGSSTDPGEVARIGRTLSPHDVINMQYTSGTTGFPKGVMLTHFNIVNNAASIGDCMRLSTDDRLLIPVPFFHCFGLVLSILACVTHGATMVPLDFFQPLKCLQAINAERCTGMQGVPTMFIAVLDHPDFSLYDLTSLRTGIMAGSPCPIEVMKQVISRMHASEITIAFGQTESSPVCTQTRTDDTLERRVSTVGRVLPGMECRIVDPATNLPVPPGTNGEFVVRGYNVMKGYYRMPEATSSAIDAEGWLHTGDLSMMDEQGYFKITGRMKDMIIRGGENLYPKEIEEFLYSHPAVKDVQCVGVPDHRYGEEVLAAIVLKDGASLTEDEVKEYVRSHMARHKTPRYVRFVDSFPMTASGKVQKFKIREWAIEVLDLKEEAAIETA